ncbi:CPBP family intramembrane metalloprotease [Psychrobacillus sp. INOP01]|uniref:CPBP family intramembrane glutamic endopeptidase n=1 Tax=Psychrobacillus sp. INOP01 TaxID=2829187 RepID=UPI001BA8B6D4|nr:CPBP family intramembrane glutamic endopeptidase [Psychrobacillus sp. INOP01]QUG40905.1 CPBP family intramembrane metalloprotease [Psychrobacillus sp. INOP01]
MFRQSPIYQLVLSLILAYCLSWITFSNEKVFWYFYTFSVFFLMAAFFYFSKMEEDNNSIRLSFLGIMFGLLSYAGILGTYLIMDMGPAYLTNSIDKFLSHYGPTAIWHYLLLIFIIAPGEEVFWRGLIQQQLKKYMQPKFAVILSSLLFGLSFIFTGFWIGILGGFFVGLVFGILYEWKKSITAIVLAHITLLVLLFLVLPFT